MTKGRSQERIMYTLKKRGKVNGMGLAAQALSAFLGCLL